MENLLMINKFDELGSESDFSCGVFFLKRSESQLNEEVCRQFVRKLREFCKKLNILM